MRVHFLFSASNNPFKNNKKTYNAMSKGAIYYSGDKAFVTDGFVSLTGGSSTSAGSVNFNSVQDSSFDSATVTSGVLFTLGDSSGYYGEGLIGDYTFTAVARDGTRYSFSASLPKTRSDRVMSRSATFDWGQMIFYSVDRDFRGDGGDLLRHNHLFLDLAPGQTLDLVYIEMVPGTQANTGHKFVSAVYSSEEIKANTAAIQSTIPVKGYTVGGVRPTFPQRGDVWMPVEGSRISGVYIYNGQAWEETNARYWTGKRWIPIYAFDLVTLQDMWDVGSSTGQDVSPPISSEYGFWNWWQKQWLEFRQWLADNLGGGSGSGSGGGGSIIFPSPSECEHTYCEKILTSPGCVQKGTALYICTKCGDSYTEAIDASGHDWLMTDSIQDELDEAGEVATPGYDLYVCSICGEEYKDFTRTGPPGSEGGSTLSELIQELFNSLGALVGSLIGWILDLGKEAMEGFGSLGEYFKEKVEAVKGFGGEYVGFLGAFFEALPSEIKDYITLALILFGSGLFVRKVFFS